MADSNNTTIITKLNYLSTTKEQIRQALNTKGVSIDTITPFRKYADEISKIHIGVDTTDATATEYDIIKPYTAYVNDRKITGKVDKINEEFQFDNSTICQSNSDSEKLFKDYTMIDNRIFHREYLENIDLNGKDFLIYMRPGKDESEAIVFTWDNSDNLQLMLINNTIAFNTYKDNIETDSLTTYIDLFIQGEPTIRKGSYLGTYFGNTSYFSTQDLYSGTDIIFNQCEKLEYDYITINQSFDSTKAITSIANNKIDIEQSSLANLIQLSPDIIKKDNSILGIKGTYEGIISQQDLNTMQSICNSLLGKDS